MTARQRKRKKEAAGSFLSLCQREELCCAFDLAIRGMHTGRYAGLHRGITAIVLACVSVCSLKRRQQKKIKGGGSSELENYVNEQNVSGQW